MIPASEPKLTNSDEVRGLKLSKAPCQNGISNRALKYCTAYSGGGTCLLKLQHNITLLFVACGREQSAKRNLLQRVLTEIRVQSQ